MLRIQKEYEKTITKKYDIENPRDIEYVPYTHIYYVSGT